MSAGERRVGGAAGRRSSGRLRRLGQLWLTGAVAAMAVTAASALGWLEPLQVRTLDLVQRLGGQRFPPEVVVVAIDEAAFERLGARQPIPRAYLASVLRGLDRSGAAVVGLDIALSVPTTAADDEALRSGDPGARTQRRPSPAGPGRRAGSGVGPAGRAAVSCARCRGAPIGSPSTTTA